MDRGLTEGDGHGINIAREAIFMEVLKAPAQHWVTINHAAAILGRERKVIDNLVRREKVVPVYGTGGHGGGYHLDHDGLVMLRTAIRLEELNVPRPAIKRLVALLQRHLGDDVELAVVYAPESEEVVVVQGEGALRDLLRRGVTIELVQPKQQREELERRIQEEELPRRRGRPRLTREWVQKNLEATAKLGDDETSPEELAELIGDRGRLPWQKP
jgi:hypothetical protein